MPLYSDRFAGHVFQGDPRYLVSVAGGCTWPTIPAYRYWLISSDARGMLAEFNITGNLFTRTNNDVDHDDGSWMWVSGPLVVAGGFIRKVWIREEETQVWVVHLDLQSGLGDLNWIWTTGYQKCNVGKELWSECLDIGCEFGETGEETMLEQVVWDEITPPT